MVKQYQKKDPFKAREAAIYEDPIASREHLIALIKDHGVGLKATDMTKALQYDDAKQGEALRRRLRAMVRDGQLVCDQEGRYHLVDEAELRTGEVIVNKDGFAKVLIDGQALRIPPRYMSQIFPGDIVQVRISGPGAHGRVEAVIVKVLEHRTKTLVGRFYCDPDGCFVVPEDVRVNHEVMVLPEDTLSAVDDELVLVAITQYPDRHFPTIGKVISVLGDKLSAPIIIDEAIETFQIPNEWPRAVVGETSQFADSITQMDCQAREDLRHLPFVTIDGEDARDFDDAVYAEQQADGGYQLWVAIADVSHYVQPDMALDKEAQKRGNSVYFPDFVVPMLPEKLSNGLCSLNPHVDRLVMVAQISISAQGQRQQYRFYPAVICSQGRLTYEYVAAFLAGDRRAEPIVGDKITKQTQRNVSTLYHLFQVLYQRRQVRGALSFDTVEPMITLDSQGHVRTIDHRERNIAHQLIEECMLQANVAAADLLLKHKVPGIFRVHQGLKRGRLEELRAFLMLRGLSLPGGDDPQPQDFNEVLQLANQREDADVIQSVMLRSLTQAEYSPDNTGHFGLAYDAYTHFTSPIRRYADLLVHRIIKSCVAVQTPGAMRYELKTLHDYAQHISMTERRADEATRDVCATLKCIYIEEHVGDVLHGVISGVTGFGFFVTLNDLFVDGLVHVTSLDKDYYRFDETSQQLIGERSGRKFSLGDAVAVQVAQVNTAARKVDFKLV
jgi:ribonuclease R